MKVTANITNPEDFDITITLTMKLSELRVIRTQNSENEKASHWPLSELTGQLREVCDQVDRVYNPGTSEETSCPECGKDFQLIGRKLIPVE
jgi:hypothetical protein